jgi:hypothetical protein
LKAGPLFFLSNGGGVTEEQKAKDFNHKLHIRESDWKLDKENLILCHTALRECDEINALKDEYVLINGFYECSKVASSLGLKKFITVEEL